MAIQMALHGGLGIIHYNMPVGKDSNQEFVLRLIPKTQFEACIYG